MFCNNIKNFYICHKYFLGYDQSPNESNMKIFLLVLERAIQ